MSSIKMNRGQRAVSSYIAPINKENYLDFGNRIHLASKKPAISTIPEDASMQIQIPQPKPEVTKRLTKIVIEPSMEVQEMSEMFKMEENQIISRDYSIDILNTLLDNDRRSRLKDILFTHNISKELRCRMIDWMIEVIATLKFTEQSFLTAVRLMDTFFMKAIRVHEPEEVHLTGVTCIYIATKFEEVHPLKLKTVFQKIGHRKLSIQSIVKKETEIMEVIGFNLIGVNHYELLEHLAYITDLKNTFGNLNFPYLKKVSLYLSKLVLFDIEIVTNYSSSTIACAILYLAFKIIVQVYPEFSPDSMISELLLFVDVQKATMTEAASKLLNLAKTFDKVHHNLHNLRKFNKFDFGELSNRPMTTR